MDDIYKKLKEHFNNPKNVGVLKNPDGYARVKNPICGDITDIYIRVKDNQIKNVKFKSYGCLVTIASASALSEAVKDKTLDVTEKDFKNAMLICTGMIVSAVLANLNGDKHRIIEVLDIPLKEYGLGVFELEDENGRT